MLVFKQEVILFIGTNKFWRESLKSVICLLLKLSKNGLQFSTTKAKMPRRGDNFWGGFSPFLESSKESLLKMPNLLSDFSQNVVQNNARKKWKKNCSWFVDIQQKGKKSHSNSHVNWHPCVGGRITIFCSPLLFKLGKRFSARS